MQVSLQLEETHIHQEAALGKKFGIPGVRVRTPLVKMLYDLAASGNLEGDEEIVELVDRIRKKRGEQSLSLRDIVYAALVSYLRKRK